MHDRTSSAAPVSSAEAAPHAAGAAAAGDAPVEAEQVAGGHAYHHPPSAMPGLSLGLLGLGAIFPGGCFVFGIVMLTLNNQIDWESSPGVYVLLCAMILLATLCFTAAAVLLVLGTISLLRAGRG